MTATTTPTVYNPQRLRGVNAARAALTGQGVGNTHYGHLGLTFTGWNTAIGGTRCWTFRCDGCGDPVWVPQEGRA
jgi:hypothetical protein